MLNWHREQLDSIIIITRSCLICNVLTWAGFISQLEKISSALN